MEVLNRSLLSTLKTQNWNQTNKEINKLCESLTAVLDMLGQGKNIQPYILSIVENCLVSGAVRQVRKLAYLIIKAAGTIYELPWSTISSSVSQDLGTCLDTEFQVYALRMLYILPLDETIQIFSAQEACILSALQGKNGEAGQSAFLANLPGILIKIWCGLGHESLQLQDAIREMFKYIASLIIDSDDRLCVYAFEALSSLFKECEEGRLRGLSQELEANGSDEEILNPLIEYLTNGLIQSLSLIIYRACSIDFRIRVKIIYPLTKLVLLAKNPIEIRRLEKECLLPVLYNLEKGIIWQASKCLIMLKPEISSLWAMCSQLLDQSPSEANPTPLLLLVTEAMSQLPISLQLSISLETLRHSNRIPSTVDRFSVLLSCLSSIVKLSKILLQSNEPSAIYQLFSQTWFVEMWMHGKHSQFREEMLCCLVESCLANYEASENWLTVGLEVVDVCFKVLDWPCDQDATYCATYFFLLLEEVCTLSKNSTLVDRVQQTLENLISRLSDTEILHYYSYAYAVLICSKYWLPLDELTLSKFMDIVRIKLFSTEIVKVDINIYKQSIQFLVCSCMHLARRFSNQCGNIMHKNLTDYLEQIEESQSDQDNISKIISLIEGYAENLEEGDFSESSPLEKNSKSYKKEPSGYFYQFLERIHVKFDEKTEEVYESMHAALNIFNRSRNESFCTTRPLEMLRIAQPEKELNWRCLRLTEITGVCDPLRAFCTHVIYPQ